MTRPLGGPDLDLRARVEYHDKQLETLTTQVTQLSSDVKSLGHSVGQLVSEWRQAMVHQHKQLESRPTQILEYVRTTLNIIQASAFLIGAVVACIVYVSSNANNGEMAVMKYRLDQAEKAIARAPADVWATKIAAAPEGKSK